MYTVYCTLCTVYCTLYTVTCIPYTVQSKQFECPTPGSKVVLGLTMSTAHKSSTSLSTSPPDLPPVCPSVPPLGSNRKFRQMCQMWNSQSFRHLPAAVQRNQLSAQKAKNLPLAPIPGKHCALSQIAPAAIQYYQEFISLPGGIGTISPHIKVAVQCLIHPNERDTKLFGICLLTTPNTIGSYNKTNINLFFVTFYRIIP